MFDWREFPRFSPDGRYIASVTHRSGQDSDISVQPVDGGAEIPLVENAGRAAAPVWAPDGKQILFTSDRNGSNDLWSIPVANGKPVGPPELMKQGIPRLLGATREGDYYYQSGSLARDLYVADLDPATGKLTSSPKRITSRGTNGGVAWSPDGALMAYYRYASPDGKLALMIRSTKTGEERELALKESVNPYSWRPQWFPDSRSLFLHSWNGKLGQLDVHTGEYRPLPGQIPPYTRSGNPLYHSYVVLAPDGLAIYYQAGEPGGQQTRIVRRELEGGSEKQLCRLNLEYVRGLSVSPDGSRLAFVTAAAIGTKNRRNAVMTVAAGGGEPKRLCELWNALNTVWSKDGRRVFFIMSNPETRPRADIASVPAEGGEPQPLGIGLHDLYFLELRPDGKQIIFADEQWNNQLWVLKNLFPAAKASR